MIYDARALGDGARLRAQVVVVGAGAGGLTAATMAAEAGLSTLLLEAGAYLTNADMTQREEQMFPWLFDDSGGRTTHDRGVKLHQGRGVGGSTLHNLCLCKRIPEAVRARWQREAGLEHLPPATWASLYDEVERLLSVSAVTSAEQNRHNQLLQRGCEALGWRGGLLSHNRTGCARSGFCELGCAYGAKNNGPKVLLRRFLEAGGEVVTSALATRVSLRRGAAVGVLALAVDPRTREPSGSLTVSAERVCLSGSATGTAALLTRSKVPDPSGRTGKTLRLHPAITVAGDFDEPVRAWEGIPQTYECTEHLRLDEEGGPRVWIVPAFAHPVGTATMVPGHGLAHRSFMERYAHLAVLTAMIHDETEGEVEPAGERGLTVRYWPGRADRAELSRGLFAAAKLLFAAGARRVLVPSRRPRVLGPGDALEPLRLAPIVRGELDVVAVHPMASVPMGDDPRRAPVASNGKHHHVEGLFVADGSLFPSSIGVPPQLSIYAMGLHVGRALARA